MISPPHMTGIISVYFPCASPQYINKSIITLLSSRCPACCHGFFRRYAINDHWVGRFDSSYTSSPSFFLTKHRTADNTIKYTRMFLLSASVTPIFTLNLLRCTGLKFGHTPFYTIQSMPHWSSTYLFHSLSVS